MTNKDIFKIWAPLGVKWVDWVRPVPFISMVSTEINEVYNYEIPHIDYVTTLEKDTAYIIDLPGHESVMEGLALAKIGYRPIPIYNGTDEQKGSIATSDNHSIEPALIYGAGALKKIELSNDAPPVFLLDSNRMNRFKMDVSVFDNSWDIYHQDMPSYKYFMNNGINKIVVVGDKFNKDLKLILYKFQKNNIKIYYTNGDYKPVEYKIKKQKSTDI